MGEVLGRLALPRLSRLRDGRLRSSGGLTNAGPGLLDLLFQLPLLPNLLRFALVGLDHHLQVLLEELWMFFLEMILHVSGRTVKTGDGSFALLAESLLSRKTDG